jgi:hypothetical protein
MTLKYYIRMGEFRVETINLPAKILKTRKEGGGHTHRQWSQDICEWIVGKYLKWNSGV